MSFINPNFANELGLIPQTTNPIILRLVNRQLLEVDQSVNIEIIFNDEKLNQEFYLLESLKENAILGMNFYHNANLTLIQLKNGEQKDAEYDPIMDVPTGVIDLDYAINKKPNGLKGIIPAKKIRHLFALWINKNPLDRQDVTPQINNFYNMEPFSFNIETDIQDEYQEIQTLLNNFYHLFAFDLKDLSIAKGVYCAIDTGDALPIKQRNYRYSERELDEIDKQIYEMLDADVIERARSPWNTPIVLVKKSEDNYRFCLDFRKLNLVTKTDVYPIPFIEDLLEKVEGCPFISIFDLKSGYWQIPMENSSKEKTAFSSRIGSFQYKVMPFGLKNAPSVFQRYVDDIFRDKINRCLNVYIDDIIVYSRTFEDHLRDLEEIFNILADNNIRIHPEKSKFVCQELRFLGFIVSRSGVRPDPDKTATVEKFPIPTKVKDVRSFIGLANFYRRFVKDFSKIVRPMTGLIRKNTKFKWTDECQEAFDRIKKSLINPPILAHYRKGCPLRLYTDASGYGLGSILCQI